ncbi:glycoside hydrolase family 5 protein [Xylaria bambusicola]|uniref:glycoside hydrolase family 5 protein n=1 Tax=Xylaria bambusicola TaxID=326684 RepID=UPI00200781FB|nr:glycoside hydrolase family 5 protein [Xylaria bambusicola]KAI0514462.1 glycoside hydrolase family 5 protein [Xylaria bambusicola]
MKATLTSIGALATSVSAMLPRTPYWHGNAVPTGRTLPLDYSTKVCEVLSITILERDTGVQYFGVNIAGFDFGCATDGTCVTEQASPPLLAMAALGGPDGEGQMLHFVNDDAMNIFRLPVGWQYLVNNELGGTLDSNNFDLFDQLVKACLDTGATCIIDVHNYARWNGQIIGQGGPTNEQFASLWRQIATKYASEEKIMFGLMNEPHDVPNINAWAQSVQAAVTAIRQAETNSSGIAHTILIPGNNYTSAAAFPTDSGPALLKVVNPDNTTTGLIFDVHKYSDSDNSGTHTECTTDNIASAFAPLADWLRTNNRQAMNTEMGGGNTESCQKLICDQIAFLNENSDVYLGYVGWAAGSFDPETYELSEVPTKNGDTWTDSALVQACFKKPA